MPVSRAALTILAATVLANEAPCELLVSGDALGSSGDGLEGADLGGGPRDTEKRPSSSSSEVGNEPNALPELRMNLLAEWWLW